MRKKEIVLIRPPVDNPAAGAGIRTGMKPCCRYAEAGWHPEEIL